MDLVLSLLFCLAAQGAADPVPAQAEPTVPIEVRLSTYFEGALSDSQNGQPFSETSGYAKLLESVSAFTPEEFAARSKTYLDHAAVMRDPDRWRGEFVNLRGIIVGLEAVRLRTPIRGATDAFRGLITTAAGTEGVWFDLLEPPPELNLQRDVVDVEGVFYRTVSYENKKGELKEAPWLIARTLHRPDEGELKRGAPRSPLPIVLIGAALAYFLVRLIVFALQQKQQRARSAASGGSSIRAMMQRQRRPREKGGSTPPSA